MTIVIPPGFFNFIMSLNETEAEEFKEIVSATTTIAKHSPRESLGLMRGDPILAAPTTKKKRKVSKYQREFGKVLKQLKRKHPRTPVTKLMKKAHRETKRRMRK
ncbi:MAG: hypothetical protein ACTSSE_18950 [Candidatus Thorarchaeota archaeon]